MQDCLITPINLGLGLMAFTLAIRCTDGTYEDIVTFKTRCDADRALGALANGHFICPER